MNALHTGLTCHGEPASADEIATVVFRRAGADLALHVDAPFHGDSPPPGAPGALDGLWNHEVVEVFLAAPDTDDYLEVELGPHGHHLVLRLSGVRRAFARCLPLPLQVQRHDTRWTATAVVPAAWLPPGPPEAWRVNVCAIHGAGPDRRYLTAARLGGVQPDFHRPTDFLTGLQF